MPADLDGFFRRIIDSIESPYRREGSAFLQTALFILQNNDTEWPRGLLEFTFLEAGDPDYAMRPGYNIAELDLVDLDALEYRVDLGKRRLNSRCMGLLEWANSPVFTNIPGSDERLRQLLYIDVDFLHRSLMELLLTADAQNILQQCTDGPFPARHFLCSAMLTKISATSEECLAKSNQQQLLFSHFCGETDRLLKAISCSTDLDSTSVDVTMYHLRSPLELLRKSLSLCLSTCFPRIISLLLLVKPSNDILIRVAIEYNIVGYVGRHVTSSMATGTRM